MKQTPHHRGFEDESIGFNVKLIHMEADVEAADEWCWAVLNKHHEHAKNILVNFGMNPGGISELDFPTHGWPWVQALLWSIEWQCSREGFQGQTP